MFLHGENITVAVLLHGVTMAFLLVTAEGIMHIYYDDLHSK